MSKKTLKLKDYPYVVVKDTNDVGRFADLHDAFIYAKDIERAAIITEDLVRDEIFKDIKRPLPKIKFTLKVIDRATGTDELYNRREYGINLYPRGEVDYDKWIIKYETDDEIYSGEEIGYKLIYSDKFKGYVSKNLSVLNQEEEEKLRKRILAEYCDLLLKTPR